MRLGQPGAVGAACSGAAVRRAGPGTARRPAPGCAPTHSSRLPPPCDACAGGEGEVGDPTADLYFEMARAERGLYIVAEVGACMLTCGRAGAQLGSPPDRKRACQPACLHACLPAPPAVLPTHPHPARSSYPPAHPNPTQPHPTSPHPTTQHRFYGKSLPAAPVVSSAKYLTVEQALADYARVVRIVRAVSVLRLRAGVAAPFEGRRSELPGPPG